MIYADFESILVSEDNGKWNSEESCKNKYQKHFACSHSYILLCVDNKFSKPFNSYLGKDTVYNFFNSKTEVSKYCNKVMKKDCNKEIMMTKVDNEDFENSIKYCICDYDYVNNGAKLADHCHIAGTYRGSAHRDCNMNVKLNHKIPVILHNLKTYYSQLIIEELDKFSIKINVTSNGLGKYMKFSINK